MTNASPMVSVILPNYNHARFLVQRLESIFSQHYSNFELIILDDCSTDSSMEIIEQYATRPQVSHKIRNVKNSGSAFPQWEKGIELAVGDFIWIAESDDFADVFFLERAIDLLQKNNTDLVFFQSEKVDETGRVIGDYFHWTKDIKSINWHEEYSMSGDEFIRLALSQKNVIVNASAVVFRKAKIDFAGIRQFNSCGDWLFWLRYLAGKKICYAPDKRNSFRSHSDTTRGVTDQRVDIRRWVEEIAVKASFMHDFPGLITEESITKSVAFSVACTPVGNFSTWHGLKKTFPWAAHYLTLCKFIRYKLRR